MGENGVEASTRCLRSDGTPFWTRLRFLIQERGFEPAAVALADLCPDESNVDQGVLVARDGSVYEFALVRASVDNASDLFIRDWHAQTNGSPDEPSGAQVELALRLLDDEGVLERDR